MDYIEIKDFKKSLPLFMLYIFKKGQYNASSQKKKRITMSWHNITLKNNYSYFTQYHEFPPC